MEYTKNVKQREILAQFYSNLALAVITFGVLAPIFSGVANSFDFSIKLILSILSTMFLLNFSLDFLK